MASGGEAKFLELYYIIKYISPFIVWGEMLQSRIPLVLMKATTDRYSPRINNLLALAGLPLQLRICIIPKDISPIIAHFVEENKYVSFMNGDLTGYCSS